MPLAAGERFGTPVKGSPAIIWSIRDLEKKNKEEVK